MRSNLRSGRLSSGGRSRGTDINPMDGVANLADLMLVMACGLMLSLIVSWNVDIGSSENLVNVEQGEELTEVDGVSDQDVAESLNNGQGYEEMGKVYRDPTTGKLYMIVNDGEQ